MPERRTAQRLREIVIIIILNMTRFCVWMLFRIMTPGISAVLFVPAFVRNICMCNGAI